jgi:hypothetical protein
VAVAASTAQVVAGRVVAAAAAVPIPEGGLAVRATTAAEVQAGAAVAVVVLVVLALVPFPMITAALEAMAGVMAHGDCGASDTAVRAAQVEQAVVATLRLTVAAAMVITSTTPRPQAAPVIRGW